MKLHKEICEKFGLNASDLPLGAIVAYADVVDCIQMTERIHRRSIRNRASLRELGSWELGVAVREIAGARSPNSDRRQAGIVVGLLVDHPSVTRRRGARRVACSPLAGETKGVGK